MNIFTKLSIWLGFSEPINLEYPDEKKEKPTGDEMPLDEWRRICAEIESRARSLGLEYAESPDYIMIKKPRFIQWLDYDKKR